MIHWAVSGPFPEFFLAAEADVQSAEAEIVRDGLSGSFPILDFESLEADELNEVVLSRLYAILTGRDPDNHAVLDELSEEHRSGLHAGSVDSGVWLIRLPARLVGALVNAPASEREVVAERWARAGEFSYPGTSVEDVRELLEELTVVAQRCVDTGQLLYARMSFP